MIEQLEKVKIMKSKPAEFVAVNSTEVASVMHTLAALPFIRLEDLMPEDKFMLYASKSWKEIPVTQVMTGRILSAPMVNNWHEALKVLPSVYLQKILNREIQMNSDQISLLEYQGLYITVGFGWKTALHKLWGNARIAAHILKAEE